MHGYLPHLLSFDGEVAVGAGSSEGRHTRSFCLLSSWASLNHWPTCLQVQGIQQPAASMYAPTSAAPAYAQPQQHTAQYAGSASAQPYQTGSQGTDQTAVQTPASLQHAQQVCSGPVGR